MPGAERDDVITVKAVVAQLGARRPGIGRSDKVGREINPVITAVKLTQGVQQHAIAAGKINHPRTLGQHHPPGQIADPV